MPAPEDKLEELVMQVKVKFSSDPAKQPEYGAFKAWVEGQAEARIQDVTQEYLNDPQVDVVKVDVSVFP